MPRNMLRAPTPIGALNELLWKGVANGKRSRRTAKPELDTG